MTSTLFPISREPTGWLERCEWKRVLTMGCFRFGGGVCGTGSMRLRGCSPWFGRRTRLAP